MPLEVRSLKKFNNDNLEPFIEYFFTPPVDAPTEDLLDWPTIFSTTARDDDEDIQGDVDGNEEEGDDNEEENPEDDDEYPVKGSMQ